METTFLSATRGAISLRDRNDLVSRLQMADLYRDYQRAFQATTGLPLALRAAGAFQLGLERADPVNPFCALLASTNRGCATWLTAQERLEAAAAHRAATLPVFASLHESAVPVRNGEQVLAFLQTGQVLFGPPSDDDVRTAAREAASLDSSLDGRELEDGYRRSRIVNREQYDSILRLLEIFAEQLSTMITPIMVKQSTLEMPGVTRARSFIADHMAEDLSLEKVSRVAGMSSFYFCKNFRKCTGITFTKYISRVRVEAVKRLLQLDPYKRVSEAAYEAGFQSLSQFNRMFNRVAGESPSTYRDRLHPRTSRAAARPTRLIAA